MRLFREDTGTNDHGRSEHLTKWGKHKVNKNKTATLNNEVNRLNNRELLNTKLVTGTVGDSRGKSGYSTGQWGTNGNTEHTSAVSTPM